jgi:hypothetical protein
MVVHQRLQQAPRLDAERVRRLQADAFGAGIIRVVMECKTHAEVVQRKRCAGVAGHSSSLLCRVPGREHSNSARLFSPKRAAATAVNFKNSDLSLARDFRPANVDAVTSLSMIG